MERRRKRIYGLSTYIIYYFAILLIPLLVVIIGYTMNYRNIRNNVIENQAEDLYQNAYICDSYIQSARNLAYQLKTNYQIKEFADNEAPSGQNTVVADMYDMHRMLSPYRVTCNYLENIQISFRKSQVVISGSTSWSDMTALWEKEYREFFPSREGWLDWLYEGEEGLQVLENPAGGTPRLLYREKVQTTQADKGYDILLLFDMEYMGRILNNVEKENISAFFLYNGVCFMEGGNGEYDAIREKVSQISIRSGYFFDNIKGRKVIIAFRKSDFMDGIYVSVIHEEMIEDSLRRSRILYAGIVLLTIMLAVASAFFFSLKTASPWNNLIRMNNLERDGEEKEAPFTLVNRHIENINRKNEWLGEELDHLKTAMLSNLMTQIMTGQFTSEEELVSGFAEAGHGILAKKYIVIILTINEVDTNKEITLYRLLINDLIRREVGSLIGFYEMGIQDEAMLLTSDEDNYVDTLSQMEKSFSGIQGQVWQEYGVNISFSGSMCTRIENIFQCVQEARAAAGYEEKRNNLSISWFTKAEKRKDTCQYSLNMEVELFQETVKGNVRKVRGLLEKIEKENFIRNQCSDEGALRLIDGMMNTVYRLVEEKEEVGKRIQDKVTWVCQWKEQNRLQKAFGVVCEIMNDISEYFNNGIYANVNLYQKVLIFIDNHYTDNQLSLTMVADTFEITEIYLSKFFKEKNGMNFSKYVEALRMQTAQELLQSSSMSVQEIAEKTGYNSPQVFRRVYKKYYGRTPRE